MTRKNNYISPQTRYIKSILKTPAAGCYVLKKLPRAVTLEAIQTIYNAMAGRETWENVYKTDLYINHGSEYCHILALLHLNYFNK